MPIKKVLITVITYPLPSRAHDELVCTAGILENGDWIRIYPVPSSFMPELKGTGKSIKWQWIELNLEKRTDDFRPESHSPRHYDFQDIVKGERLGTEQNWYLRKQICLKNCYTNLNQLIEDSKAPNNCSLATFKPTKILGFEIEQDEREWKDEWKEVKKQQDLFAPDKTPEKTIPKLPYKFRYRFEDDAGKESYMMIEDWEIGQLFWNCLRDANGNEELALEKVRHKYEADFIQNKDLYFFLGTTKQWHMRRARNPFVIIGVFYPKKETQISLF